MKYPILCKITAFVASQTCLTPVLAAPAKPQTGGSYTVRQGDTFAKIARSRGIPLGDLLKANRNANPDCLVLGQRIIIPGTKPALATSPPPKAAPGTKKTTVREVESNLPHVKSVPRSTTVNLTPPPVEGTYIVQSGDTLHRIQRQTGTSVQSLIKLNGLTETSTIRPGQVLRTAAGTQMAKQRPAAVRVAPRVREEETPVIIERLTEPVDALQPVIEDHPPAPPPATGTLPHRIESGDTFSSLARHYHVSATALAAANRNVNPSKLRIGQTVMIPGQTLRTPAQPQIVRPDGRVLAAQPDPLAREAVMVAETPRTRTGYLVGEGETMRDIADRFYTTEAELRRLNRLGESDTVYPGRYILVPFHRETPPGIRYARRDA